VGGCFAREIGHADIPRALSLGLLAAHSQPCVGVALGRAYLRHTENLSTQSFSAESQRPDSVAALADAVIVADAAGAIVKANSVAERMFGYSRDELLTLRVEALMPAAFRIGHEAQRSAYLTMPRHRVPAARRLNQANGVRSGSDPTPARLRQLPARGGRASRR
jgi:PAS domain S-box-containing protein